MAAMCAHEPQGRSSGVSRERPSTAVPGETRDAHAQPSGSVRDAAQSKENSSARCGSSRNVAAP